MAFVSASVPAVSTLTALVPSPTCTWPCTRETSTSKPLLMVPRARSHVVPL